MSLRLSLILSIFMLMLVTLGVGIAGLYATAGAKLETEMTSAVRIAARITERALENIGPPFTGPEVIERLIATYDGDRHVRAVLIGPHGVLLAASTAQAPETPAPAWFVDLLDVPPKFKIVELPPIFEGVGTLMLQSNSYNEISEVWEDAQRTLALLSGLCALTLALVSWQLTRALRPLDALSAAFRKGGDAGSLPRVPVAGPSELQQVATGFNDMAERLERTEAQNRRLNAQLAEVQEEERGELARDLHDEIGPFLFAVDVDAKAIADIANERQDEAIGQRIGAIREAIARLRRTVRELLGRLKPAALLDLGLPHAVEHVAAFWRGRKPEVTISVDVDEDIIEEAVMAAAFRIVQESLSNAMRHGKPTRVEVRVTMSEQGRVDVLVADNGIGLEPARGFGFGISGMKDRVRALGGTLSVGNRSDGSGVIVHASLPAEAPGRTANQSQQVSREVEAR
ncbi:MAG: histidine kinase [Hyphomicrobiaceae bacterium]|nr:histidine kinase [Hyphomicrobiaceae bacterium]